MATKANKWKNCELEWTETEKWDLERTKKTEEKPQPKADYTRF